MLRVSHITRAGLLVAASVVLTRFFGTTLPLAGVLALRLSFGDIPIILAGLTLGPGWGAAVGAAADVIGYGINPMGGAYFPGFTLTAALVGVLPVLFMRLFTRGVQGKPGFWRYLAAIACSDLITSVALNTFWLHVMYGRALAAILPARVITRAILVPVYAGFITVMAQNLPILVPMPARASKKS